MGRAAADFTEIRVKVRFSRTVYAVLTAAGALALTLGVEQYGTLLRHNYGAIARQGGTTVNGGAQLLFVLKNPLRYHRGFAGHTV